MGPRERNKAAIERVGENLQKEREVGYGIWNFKVDGLDGRKMCCH